MKYKKIIFLDVDGVINIPDYTHFDPNCMDRVREIIRLTGSKIVVSSSWRAGSMEFTKKNLRDGGFPQDLENEIIGETIRGYNSIIKGSKLPIIRGNEIKAWVDTQLKYPWHANPEMDQEYRLFNEDGSFKMMRSNEVGKDYSYVILDDDNDMLLEQRDYFIQTDSLLGLLPEHAQRAVKILNQIDK